MLPFLTRGFQIRIRQPGRLRSTDNLCISPRTRPRQILFFCQCTFESVVSKLLTAVTLFEVGGFAFRPCKGASQRANRYPNASISYWLLVQLLLFIYDYFYLIVLERPTSGLEVGIIEVGHRRVATNLFVKIPGDAFQQKKIENSIEKSSSNSEGSPRAYGELGAASDVPKVHQQGHSQDRW